MVGAIEEVMVADEDDEVSWLVGWLVYQLLLDYLSSLITLSNCIQYKNVPSQVI